GFCTFTTASASHALSTMVAPASSNASSSNDAAPPAPRSTTTSCPASTSLATTSGTSATRRSPGAVSFGTPIFTCATLCRGHPPPRSRLCSRALAHPADDLDSERDRQRDCERDQEALEGAVLERLPAEVAEQSGI